MNFLLVARRSTRRSLIKRFLTISSSTSTSYPIAIVGSGPSGFYTAKYLLEQNEHIKIDVYERLPFPYGLVRYGVAPDHPEVKTVINTFEELFQNPKYGKNRIRYFGNIEIGDSKSPESTSMENTDENLRGHLSLDKLLSAYSAVVLAYGAKSDRDLHLLNEFNYQGIVSSREFVNFYNGHPDYRNFDNTSHFRDKNGNYKKIKNVVIIGNGNVAIDCARVLMRDLTELSQTDIHIPALKWIEFLQSNCLEKVIMIGRRGHIQASFTIKEFRELTKLTNNGKSVPMIINEKELKEGSNESSLKEIENNRPKKRIIELVETTAKKSTEYMTNNNNKIEREKRIEMRFLLSPTELISDQNDPPHISAIKVQKNQLSGEAHHQKAEGIPSEEETLPCDLLIKSIGYKSVSIHDWLPFNKRTNTVPHEGGKVLFSAKEGSSDSSSSKAESKEQYQDKLYVTGWLKRGPSGIIGTNITDAKETVASIIEGIKAGKITPASPDTVDATKNIMADSKDETKHTRRSSIFEESLDWSDIQKLNQLELEKGEKEKKIRVKLTDPNEILSIVKQNQR
jgi:adrenodoxin-NADP+ reductase